MQIGLKPATLAVFCGLLVCACAAQPSPPRDDNASHGRKAAQPLNSDDRLAVISAALDSKADRNSGRDCSHLVHTIYERAGFPYTYASSDDLYAGVEGFQRVSHPQPGDLIVWPGHAGIVVRPSRHTFFSFLSAGPGTDDYQSRYWKTRGKPRFYRYLKNDPCPGCASADDLRRTRADR